MPFKSILKLRRSLTNRATPYILKTIGFIRRIIRCSILIAGLKSFTHKFG